MSATITWKLNRLRAMSVAEVGWRVRQSASARLQRWGIGLARDVNAGTAVPGSPWVSPLPQELPAPAYVEAADRTLAGRWDILSLRDCRIGFPPRWNRDHKTGVEAPLDFGKDIDPRNERIVGDIKYLWEPNRHLELVTLAQAWHLTREPRFADAARCLLSSWLQQCPYPRGPNWTSSLELGIRLVNWACAWHLLGGDAWAVFAAENGQAVRQRWLRAIYQHCHFISGNLSRHSSANNHLLGELTGLFVASVTWPLWPQSVRWREHARGELEAEAMKQISADGADREQAFWYHHAVADSILLCLLFGRATGIDFSGQFAKRLELMLEFIAAVMDARGHVPMVGDADDALVVRFSRDPEFCPYRSLLATGAVLFGRGDFKALAGRFDDKSRWLLGDKASEQFDALQVATGAPVRLAFREGGYYILGQDFGGPREVKAVVDAGSLGYLSIAAHGHADALAFTLSVGGNEILVDPGTYAFHGQKRWRAYFRGTSAHNTLRVDGEDQSVRGGDFLWARHARARCEQFETGAGRDVFEGVHDGYLRLDDPVLHRRRIEFDKQSMSIEVRDTVECGGEHFVEIHWHLAEHCVARSSGHCVHIERAGLRMRVECPRELDVPALVVGQDDPPLGWISRRLDYKTPSPVIVCKGRVGANTTLVTLFTIETGSCAGSPE
jgi:Heparinase II/III-like protein/Heparinase II/III N-terminus